MTWKDTTRSSPPPWIRGWREWVRHDLAALSPLTDSPIEGLMLAALLVEDDGSGGFFFSPRGPHRIECQREVVFDTGPYFIDFAITVGRMQIAVEVDGFAFHDITPAIAAASKARTRNLTALGWEVMPFAGSDVSRDPRRCAHEVRARVEQLSSREAVEQRRRAADPLAQELAAAQDDWEAEVAVLRKAQERALRKRGLL